MSVTIPTDTGRGREYHQGRQDAMKDAERAIILLMEAMGVTEVKVNGPKLGAFRKMLEITNDPRDLSVTFKVVPQ